MNTALAMQCFGGYLWALPDDDCMTGIPDFMSGCSLDSMHDHGGSMFSGNGDLKLVELRLGGPVGPMPPRILALAPHLIRLMDEESMLSPGETVSIRLVFGEKTLFELFGRVAEHTGSEASILLMATTPGFVPWLARAAKMGYLELEEVPPSVSQIAPGLTWSRPSDPSPVKN